MFDISLFERIIVRSVAVLVMLITGVAAVWLFVDFTLTLWSTLIEIDTVFELQDAVQEGLAGVFVVLLGLELLETLKAFASHRRFRLETVLVVGAIVVARHIIQLDLHQMSGAFLAGLGVLIASLVGGFVMLHRLPPGDERHAPAQDRP